MRRSSLTIIVASAVVLSTIAPSYVRGYEQAAAIGSCAARAPGSVAAPITWHIGPVEDEAALEQWCRGVGPPLYVPVPVPVPVRSDNSLSPRLDDLAVITWNAHLAEGRVTDLIAALRDGRFTDGRPVRHFVLLLQELYRRGSDVPAFRPDARSALAVEGHDPRAPDVRDYSLSLGLSTLYVPSMRNGVAVLEDRGNAIMSTEPLVDALALELPFERQRRVAIGAAIEVMTAQGAARLNVLNVHLEPLSAPSLLWVFQNPRRRQMATVLDLLREPAFEPNGGITGTVLGGDFNTIQGGDKEAVYGHARAWSRGLLAEDRRGTHEMGRIDYLFFRLTDGWTARTTRLDERFGSDHYPVLGRFASDTRTP